MDTKFFTNPFVVKWKKKLDKLYTKEKEIKATCLCDYEIKCNSQITEEVAEGQMDAYELAFWSEKISTRNDPEVAIIDGHHYRIGSGKNKTKGMGGRLVRIQFDDGRIIDTNDLWHQGKIPESYRQVLSDNAQFLEYEII